jgi:hypothetical protein
VCALAILVAGVVQLLRISSADDPQVELLVEGQSAIIGDVSLALVASARTGNAFEVTARFGPAAPGIEVPITSFTLLAGGKLEQPTNGASASPPACGSTIVVGDAGASCVVSFAPRDGSATVAFSRQGDQQIWRLDPTTG